MILLCSLSDCSLEKSPLNILKEQKYFMYTKRFLAIQSFHIRISEDFRKKSVRDSNYRESAQKQKFPRLPLRTAYNINGRFYILYIG